MLLTHIFLFLQELLDLTIKVLILVIYLFGLKRTIRLLAFLR